MPGPFHQKASFVNDDVAANAGGDRPLAMLPFALWWAKYMGGPVQDEVHPAGALQSMMRPVTIRAEGPRTIGCGDGRRW